VRIVPHGEPERPATGESGRQRPPAGLHGPEQLLRCQRTRGSPSGRRPRLRRAAAQAAGGRAGRPSPLRGHPDGVISGCARRSAAALASIPAAVLALAMDRPRAVHTGQPETQRRRGHQLRCPRPLYDYPQRHPGLRAREVVAVPAPAAGGPVPGAGEGGPGPLTVTMRISGITNPQHPTGQLWSRSSLGSPCLRAFCPG